MVSKEMNLTLLIKRCMKSQERLVKLGQDHSGEERGNHSDDDDKLLVLICGLLACYCVSCLSGTFF